MTSTDESSDLLELYCPGCGYDLRGIDSERCPECGQTIDRSTLGRSIIPWVQRARLGTCRAFWRTVWMATSDPRQFGKEMSCPARLSDARKFRWMVVAHMVLALVVLLVLEVVVPFAGSPFSLANLRYYVLWSWADLMGSVAQLLLILVSAALAIIGLYAITGVASFFFAPFRLSVVQQNRAIAISYYSSAPMVFTLLTLPAWYGVVMLLPRVPPSPFDMILMGLILLVGLTPLVMQPFTMLRSPLLMLAATTHVGIARVSPIGVLLPILWVAVGAFFVVLLPAMLFTAIVILLSFRS